MQTLLKRRIYSLEEDRKNASYVWLLLVYLAGYLLAALFTPLYVLQDSIPGAFVWEEGAGVILLRLLFPVTAMLLFSIHPLGIGMIPLIFLCKGFSDGCLITSVMAQAKGDELYRALLTMGPELFYCFWVVAWYGACAHYNAVRLYRGEAGIHFRNLYILIQVTSAKRILWIFGTVTLLVIYRLWLIPFLLT